MRVLTLIFFSFFMCNFIQAGLVKKVCQEMCLVAVSDLKKIKDMVASRQQGGFRPFEMNKFMHLAQYRPYVSKDDDDEAQRAALYVLSAEIKRQKQTNVYAHQKKAVLFLAMFPLENIDDLYPSVAQRVAKDEMPWDKNWASKFDFLKQN